VRLFVLGVQIFGACLAFLTAQAHGADVFISRKVSVSEAKVANAIGSRYGFVFYSFELSRASTDWVSYQLGFENLEVLFRASMGSGPNALVHPRESALPSGAPIGRPDLLIRCDLSVAVGNDRFPLWLHNCESDSVTLENAFLPRTEVIVDERTVRLR
jgi:hypothetical protein